MVAAPVAAPASETTPIIAAAPETTTTETIPTGPTPSEITARKLQELEMLKKRAERFGLTDKLEELKKKERALKYGIASPAVFKPLMAAALAGQAKKQKQPFVVAAIDPRVEHSNALQQAKKAKLLLEGLVHAPIAKPTMSKKEEEVLKKRAERFGNVGGGGCTA